jgi:adenylate cyclase
MGIQGPAIDLDPTFAGGYRGLAMAYRQAAAVFQTHSPTEAHSSAESLARRAIALDGGDAEAHSTLAGRCRTRAAIMKVR